MTLIGSTLFSKVRELEKGTLPFLRTTIGSILPVVKV